MSYTYYSRYVWPKVLQHVKKSLYNQPKPYFFHFWIDFNTFDLANRGLPTMQFTSSSKLPDNRNHSGTGHFRKKLHFPKTVVFAHHVHCGESSVSKVRQPKCFERLLKDSARQYKLLSVLNFNHS
jgi:hypothetical protein